MSTMDNNSAMPQELRVYGRTIDQLLERGEALRDAMMRSVVQDELLVVGDRGAASEAQASNLQEILFDYLLGKEMSPSDENKALDMLSSLPRVDSLFQPLDPVRPTENDDQQMRVVISPRSQALSNATTLKLKLCVLVLNESGLRQLKKGNKLEARLPNPIFLLEYVSPRSCGQQEQYVRVTAQKNTDRGVLFGQEKLHSFDNKNPIIFNIYFRKLVNRSSVLLGCAKFDWNELIEFENTIFEFNLPVQHPVRKETIGRLKIKALLGQGSFLSASLSQHQQQENTESAGSRTGTRSLASKACPSTSAQSKNAQETAPQNSESAREQAVLLQGLIYITHTRGFSVTKLFNLHAIFKAFWVEDDLQSQIKWKSHNPIFNLHENTPVLLSPFFLGRCRGNHAIIEIWDVATLGDNLIGLAKLPLQTFYLAYQDPVVARKLLSYKLPVISVDHWVQVINPLTGETVGEVRVLLAFGSNEQVDYLEGKRGLRGEVPPPLYQQVDTDSSIHLVHQLRIDIEKIVDFEVLDSIADDQAKCFVVCSILGETDTSIFNYVSKLSPCTRETKIDSHIVREFTLPAAVPFSNFFEDRLPTGVMFSVFCQFYQPVERDVMVAKAFLPISQLKNLQQIFENTGSLAILNVGLCLTFIPCPELPMASEDGNGHLLLQLSYSAYPDNHTSVKQLESRTTYSMTTTKSQACQTEDSPPRQSATQTSIQLTDFDPEVEFQIPSRQEATGKEISTQTSLQLVDFVPESEESDQECRFVPSPELELPSADEAMYQNIEHRIQEVPENNNLVSSHNSNKTIELDTSISDEIIPKSDILSTERNQVLKESRPPTPPLLFRDPTNIAFSKPEGPTFRAIVLVERAVNLPVLQDKFNHSQLAPSTYITMQAEQSGMLVASNLVIKSCNPVYDWQCNINLPVHLLMPGDQRLILKLCFAISDEIGHNPEQDIIACFTTIDLQVLLTGQRQISAWFDLLDYAGNSQGQLKVCITPLENLESYVQLRNAVLLHQMHCVSVSGSSQQHSGSHTYQLPENPFSDLSSSALERKLQEQLSDFDVLANELKSKVAAMNIEDKPQISHERPKLVVRSTSKSISTQGFEHPELMFPPSDFVNIPANEFKLPPPPTVESTHSHNKPEPVQVTQNPGQIYPLTSFTSLLALHATKIPTTLQNPGTSYPIGSTQNPCLSDTHCSTEHATHSIFREPQNYLLSQHTPDTVAQYPSSSHLNTDHSIQDLYKNPTPSCSTDITFERTPQNYLLPPEMSPHTELNLQPSHSGNLPTASIVQNDPVSQNPGSYVYHQGPSVMPVNPTTGQMSERPSSGYRLASHEELPIQHINDENNVYSTYSLCHQISVPNSDNPFLTQGSHSEQDSVSSEQFCQLNLGHEDNQSQLSRNPQSCKSNDLFQSFQTSQISVNHESQYSRNQIVPNNISQVSLDSEGRNILEEAFRKFPFTLDDPLFNYPNPSDPSVPNESTSSDSNDPDVSKLMSNFDFDTLLRIFEHLEDEAQKAGRCSKPDYVCEKKHANVQTQFLLSDIEGKETDELEILTPVPRQAPEGGNPSEKDKNSRASTSSEGSKNQPADDSSGE